MSSLLIRVWIIFANRWRTLDDQPYEPISVQRIRSMVLLMTLLLIMCFTKALQRVCVSMSYQNSMLV